MSTKEFSLKIDQEGKLINITGISSNAVSIDYSGDIDFTKLVTELTHSIDSKSLLSPKEDNDISDDNTLKLILETIDTIIEEYNNSVRSLDDSEDEEDEDGEVGEDNEDNEDWGFEEDPLF